MLRTAVLIPAEEGGFIALNPETGTTTQGETVPEALENLREIKTGTLADVLRQAGGSSEEFIAVL